MTLLKKTWAGIVIGPGAITSKAPEQLVQIEFVEINTVTGGKLSKWLH